MLKKSRNIQKYFVISVISLVGLACFLGSLVNAIFVDIITGAVRGKTYRNYVVNCGPIEGNLVSGFLIQDIKIVTVKNANPVVELDSLFIRINPLDLLQKRLTISQSKLYDLKVHVRNFDEFIQNLVSLFGQNSQSQSGSMSHWFDSISCSNMYFYNLQLRNTLEMLFTNREFLNEYDLQINEKIRFEGSLEWDTSVVRLRASATDGLSRSSLQKLPLSLELQFDLQNYSGELAVLSEGTPLDRLVTMRGLSFDGSVTMESRLKFSQFAETLGFGAKKAQMRDGRTIYYALNGQGRLFSSSVKFERFQLQDLYLRALWTQEQFNLQHSQSIFLGSHVGLAYSYDPIASHKYSVKFKDLDVQRLFKLLEFEQLSEDLKGEVSFGLEGDLDQIKFSPLVVKSMSYLNTPLYLQNIQIDPIKPDFFAENFKLVFESRGGSYMGAFVDKVRGFLDREKLTFSMICDGVNIQDIEPLKRRSRSLGVSGRANVMFGGQVRFAEKDYILSASGDFFELEVAGLPVESLHFNYNKKQARNLWTWHLKLPMNDGRFDFEMDFLKQKGSIHLNAEKFDLAYFKQRLEDFPLSGLVNAKLRVDFEPELTIKITATSDKLEFFDVPLSKSFLEIYLKKNKFQFKLRDENLFSLVHGEHRLFDMVNSKEIKKIKDYVDNFRFEFKDKSLERFIGLPRLNQLRFKSGELDIAGKYQADNELLQVDVSKFNISGEHTQFDLRSSKPFNLAKFNTLEGSTEIWANDLLDRVPRKLARLNFSDNTISVNLDKFRLSLLREFINGQYPLPFHGVIDFNVMVQNAFKDPQYQVDFKASPLYVDMDGQNTYLEQLSGGLSMSPGGIQVRNFVAVKQGSEFIVDGFIPTIFNQKRSKFEIVEAGELDLRVKFPETPLSILKDLIPSAKIDGQGHMALDLEVKGSPKTPTMSGIGNLAVDFLRIPGTSEEFQLSNGRLDFDLMDQSIVIKRLQGRLGELIFYLTGEIFPMEDFKFFLKGDLAQADFRKWFLNLTDARLSDVLINGSGDYLQASASLSAKKGLLSYEQLMRWIDRDSAPLSIPYFPHYDFEINVKKSEKLDFKGEFFHMAIDPNLKIKLRPKNSFVDGSITVREGFLELARNNFKIEPGSLIRFVPREQKLQLSIASDEQDPKNPIWSSGNFQLQSMTDKLQTMWEKGYMADVDMYKSSAWFEGEKAFDTFLNLRAITEINDRQISIVMNGPLETLNYSLNSDDENLGKGEILRLLASRGVGASNSTVMVSQDSDGNNVYELNTRDDEKILSGQLSATLEDEVLGKPFENFLGSIFNFQQFSLEPNLLGNQNGLGRFKMGTRLSKDLTLTHESENLEFGSKRETKLELKLDEELGLILKREQKIDKGFDLFRSDSEKDLQFGFERRLKF